MSRTLDRILELVSRGEVEVSAHGAEELEADGILVREALAGLPEAEVVEDYPQYPKGPCVLVLEKDESGKPFHALWGIPRRKTSPAVLITVYRPRPERWSDSLKRRRR